MEPTVTIAHHRVSNRATSEEVDVSGRSRDRNRPSVAPIRVGEEVAVAVDGVGIITAVAPVERKDDRLRHRHRCACCPLGN